jgi:hypothetical protein
MDRNIWNSLAHFQAHDLIQRAFKDKHSRELNAERAWEINACFIQGEEYFRNATLAAESVRPLLLFYGVSSLSRGIILFGDASAREVNLKASHGLGAKDWKRILSTSESVLNLAVEVQSGIFSDLVRVTDPDQVHPFPTLDGGLVFQTVPDARSLKEGQVLTFADVLSRIQKLSEPYKRVTGDRPNFRFGMVVYTESAFLVHLLHDPVGGVTSSDEVRRLYRVPDEISIGLCPSAGGITLPNFAYRVDMSQGHQSIPLPVTEPVEGSDLCALEMPWPSSIYVSPLCRCYLTAYFLGMLVRYFPSRWMALIGSRKGDMSLPLLRAAIGYVEDEFPKLALNFLSWA